MMKRTRAIGAILCSSMLLVAGHAIAQGAAVGVAKGEGPGMQAKVGEVVASAKVVELDLTQRILTVRKPNGELVALDVPAEVKNLDQVRVGDDLVLRYAIASLVALEPTGGKAAIRERTVSTSSAVAPAGSMPGIAGRRTVQVLAVIDSLDKKGRKATLRGPKRTITVDVPAEVDLSKVKKGDEVRATIVEGAALTVERAADKK